MQFFAQERSAVLAREREERQKAEANRQLRNELVSPGREAWVVYRAAFALAEKIFHDNRMNDVKVSRTVVVNNPQGLHARPADLIVRLAKQYQAKIEIVKENNRVDGKSILDLLTLAAVQGTSLELEATGSDADAALEALAQLFASCFAEGDVDQQTTTG